VSAKTRPIFNNFSSGEISPKIDGRIDLTQYFNGVQELRNWLCVPQGGAKTRGGFHFVATTKNNEQARLIPFQFSELQNYILEFGDEYIRFFMNCGQIMVGDGAELVTNGDFPAGIASWLDISIGTGTVTWDTNHMEISGEATGIGWAEQEITTVDESVYLLEFDVTAFPLTVRIGSTSGDDDILADTIYAVGVDHQLFFTANGTSAFIQFKTASDNLAELDNVSCQLAIPYEIVSPYYSDDDLWSIRFVQDDENLFLVHPLYPPQVLTRGVGHTSFTIDPITFIDGPYEDQINTPTITPSATTGNIFLTASAPLFNVANHVGTLWRILNGAAWGYVVLVANASNSTTHFHATVLTTLGGVGASTYHCEGAWSDLNGWPRAICFHEGKLLFASTYEHPQTIWGSKSGKYNDFTPGVLDNDSYSFTPSDLNIIRWISPGRVLSIGAFNAEATAVGPSDGPITAVDPPRIKSETNHGSSDLIAPVKVGKAILFLQKAARKIREFVYSYTEDAYGAPDITMASEHLFDLDILDLVYQQEPDSMLWALRADGVLLPCTYDRTLDPTKGGIVGWAKAYTDGLFESIATIPYQDKDQLWAMVIRTIGGVTKRYIEYYDPDICVDSGLTYSGAATTTISGLKHLVGKSVVIVGDGAPYPAQIVPASGELTIDPPASEIYVGLAYTPTLVTNRPEVQISGTSQGLMKAWNKIIVRVLETTGITINGQVVPARTSEDLMGSAPAPFTGEVHVLNLGWDTEGRITIIQPLPLPAHIISITGDLVVGDS
jgi:hypothetical protein